MVRILIILFLFSLNVFSQTKVLFLMSDIYGWHDTTVYNEFIAVYKSVSGNDFDTNNSKRIMKGVDGGFEYADTNGYSYVVSASIPDNSIFTYYRTYYPKFQLIMCTGALILSKLPEIVIVTGGTDSAVSYGGYNAVEFYDTSYYQTLNYRSWICAGTAAKLCAIRDYALANGQDTSLWAIRFKARVTATFYYTNNYVSRTEGYGRIDYEKAITYTGRIWGDYYIPDKNAYVSGVRK